MYSMRLYVSWSFILPFFAKIAIIHVACNITQGRHWGRASLADDFDGAVGRELDDGGGVMGGGVGAAVVGHIVGGGEKRRIYLAERGRRRGSADVGRGADYGAAQHAAQARSVVIGRDAYAHAAVGCEEVGSEVDASVINDSQRTDSGIKQLVGHIGDAVDISLEHGYVAHESDESLGVVASFEGVDAADGLGVGGIASDAPYGVGGVDDYAAAAQRVYGHTEVIG